MKHTVDEIVLDNGAKGLLLHVPNATVMGIELNFRAGDYLTPKGKWEVAHLLEHMMFGANKKFQLSREFSAELQKNGAYVNASTSVYHMNYIMECADFEWDRVLELMQIGLQSPLLNEKDFIAETGNVREELTGRLNEHFLQMVIAAREKAGITSLSDIKRLEQLDSIELADIHNFYEKTHHTDNLRFVIAGDMTKRKDFITKLFDTVDLPRGNYFSLPIEVPQNFGEVHYLERVDLSNLYFLFHVFASLELEPAEEDALALVNTMLTATLHSKILGEVREKGLAYDITSHHSKARGLADWWFGAEIMPQNAEQVFDIIVRELKAILQGKISSKDIESAKQYSLGRYQRSVQTVRGLINGYSEGYFFEDRIDDYYAIPERIKAVTKQDMISVVKRMFLEKTWGLTIMGTGQSELAERLNGKLAILWE